MKEMFSIFYNNLAFMQICFDGLVSLVLFILLKYIICDKNFFGIKEILSDIFKKIFNKIKDYFKALLNNLFFLIFVKHLNTKKYFILVCIILIVIFSFYPKTEWIKMLIGILVSALVTFLFLDSIKQYNNELKFIPISTKIKENILNSYCYIFHILNSTLSQSENNLFFKTLSMPVSAENITKLEDNIQSIEILDNKKLGERDTIVANSYMSQLKNIVSKTYELIKSTNGDLEIHFLTAKLLDLFFTLENVDIHYFDAKYDKGMKIFIGGLNTSLIKEILKEYCDLYRIIDGNGVLKNINIQLSIDMGMAVAIQEKDGTIRNAK